MVAWRDWFHDVRPEIWKKLADEMGARYTSGTWKTADRIQVSHGHWTVTLDTFTVHATNAHIPYTRLRAPFQNESKLRLKLSRKSIFTPIGKFFGMQDIEIGEREFDDAFVIKGSAEHTVKEFLAHAGLRAQLLAQANIQLSVEDDEGWFGTKFPPHADELRVVISGHEKDPERIRALFNLLTDALEQLCAIGVAAPRDPGVELR